MKTIAIIDDDIHIGDMLEEFLRKNDFNVVRAYSGTEALYLLNSKKVNLILLDLMLPGLSGEEVIKKISGIPVIVISAKTDVNDKINMLVNGAVDYVTKPFDLNELLARITVHLKMSAFADSTPLLTFSDITVNTASHEVMINNDLVKLTKTEYAILKILIQNPHQAIAKSVLLDRISEDTPDCTESSLKQHISNLRKKLRDTGGKEYIEAVWGIGFKMTNS